MQFRAAGSPLRLCTVFHRYKHLIHRVFHSGKHYLQPKSTAFPQSGRTNTTTTIFFIKDQMMNWVKDILGHYNLDDEFSDQQILLLWDEIVGPRLSHMARATRFSHGTLIVEVSSAVVSQELSLLRQRYIDLLNERMERPILQRIRFVPGHFPHSRSVQIPDVEDNTVDDDLALSDIDDAQLRTSFGSLYRTLRRRERAMLRAGARRCPRCGVVFFGDTEICPGCQFDEIDDK